MSYPDRLTVIPTDEITLENGENRKRFIFDQTEPWIEGVGSVGGLFHDAMALLTGYNVSCLICFKQNNIPLFINTEKCSGWKML